MFKQESLSGPSFVLVNGMWNRLFKILLLSSSLMLLTACPNPPPAEEPCNFVQNSFNRRVSWARFPVKFYADPSISDRQYVAMVEAMEVWNQYFDMPVLQMIGRALPGELPAPRIDGEGRVIADGINAIYLVSEEVFQNTSSRDEQARTSISFRGDFIFEADVIIDGSETFYFQDQSIVASNAEVQFKSLMIHEFGHVLGLGHVEIPGTDSVMYPRLSYGQMRPEPVKNESGVVQFDENGATRLELPEVDLASLACEYQ